jgi:tRNA1(Val) A37 N6-methylase TrmN6
MKSLVAELSPLRALLAARIALIMNMWERNATGETNPPDELAAPFDNRERAIFHLLVAPRRVCTADIVSTLGANCVTALIREGVLRTVGQDLESNGLRLRFHAGRCFFAGDGGAGRYVHLGYDTLLLIEAAARLRPAAKALELCCGGAIAATVLAGTHQDVTAVDLFKGVCDVAKVNIALAGLDRVRVRTGDLWEPIEGERFDTIIANPPFLPSPDGREIDPAAVAGEDGLDFTRAIWEAADAFLVPGGTLLLVTGLFSTAESLLAHDELVRLARDKRWKIEVIASEPQRPIERLGVALLQDEPSDDRSRNILERARQLRATHYQVALLRMCDDPNPGVVMVRAYPEKGAQMRTRMHDLRRQRLSRK